jgi:hypothetical protein
MKQPKTLKVAKILTLVVILLFTFITLKDFAIKQIVNLNLVNSRAVATSISTDFERSNNSSRNYSSHLIANVKVS